MKKSVNKRPEDEKKVKDPVCGMVKPKSQMKAKTVYKGKTYYFCWERDKQMFLANPEHWIPRNTKGVVKK